MQHSRTLGKFIRNLKLKIKRPYMAIKPIRYFLICIKKIKIKM
ncbi:hypothetical protein HMPREF1253_1654 [Peptoniphilus sp. BV3C26]|nr:hypothetical protein HMPREF1253_1654 [Peptoniphilus sp. BV3C26]